jgi:predicted secreted protein
MRPFLQSDEAKREVVMRAFRLVRAVPIVVLALLCGPVRAADDLVIPLKFIPTKKLGSDSQTLREGISNKPIAVAIEDSRQVKTKDLVGEGTGSGDTTFRIRYAGHLPSYLKTTVQDRFGTWGVQTNESSDLLIMIRVTRFHVLETHAFYGSIFTAEVQLPWTLTDRAGHVFASGTALGTGKTKGRWRNPINCEEVLADALQQAAAGILADAKLQEAWLAAVPKPAPEHVAADPTAPARPQGRVDMAVPASRVNSKVPPAVRPKTPAQLLADVKQLRREQVGTGLLVDYVSRQTLASAFSANDLVQWKKAGVPEPVMAAALQRAP